MDDLLSWSIGFRERRGEWKIWRVGDSNRGSSRFKHMLAMRAEAQRVKWRKRLSNGGKPADH